MTLDGCQVFEMRKCKITITNTKYILLHVRVEAPALWDDQVVGLHLLQGLVVLLRGATRIHLKEDFVFNWLQIKHKR